ncbi:hypothetical protein F5887DRAFT_1063412 [Amanita rubescens]|nr:hypothetical protein F5887DRAFT_1063412 [Amanita rubescens]
MGVDYYKLLGIAKGASDDDIKKAYKKMALRWHPDRNAGSEEANQKFKEISEAFEVLSDSQKRAVYDQFGEEGLKGGGGPPPGAGGGFPGGGGFSGFPAGSTFTFSSGGGFTATDPQKIFEQIFGGGLGGFGGRSGGFSMDQDDDMGGFGGMGGMPRRGSFRSAAGGTPRNESPSKKETTEIVRQLKLSLNELYSGTTKRLKVGRRLLDGTTEDKVVEIHSGTKVRFPKAGNELSNGDAQDLVFVVEEKPHEVLKRAGNDLIATLKISPGGCLLDGRRVQVPAPVGIVKPGAETRIPGEGMPIRKGGVKSKGDLIVKWEVEFPEKLTPAQKEGIRKVMSGS